MKSVREAMKLYAITNCKEVRKNDLLATTEAALKNGITCLQLREKNLNEEEFLAEALKLKKLCNDYGVPFIINDNVDIAVKSNADGVHVGQEDLEAGKARQIIGNGKLLGVSAQTVEDALKAQEAGADYIGVGSMFPTGTKLDASTISIRDLKEICSAVKIPVVAIGGINEDNVLELSGSGIDGISVVSAIYGAADAGKATKNLLELSEKMLNHYPN